MKKRKKQADRRGNEAVTENIVREEFRKLSEDAKRAETKRKKLKKRCRDQEARLETLEAEVKQGKEKLELEKKEGARREVIAKIQAHLAAWRFYHEGEESEL